MTPEQAETTVLLYLQSEEDLEKMTHNIPFAKKTKDLPLPVLSSLIVEAGSLLDTIFRSETNNTKSRNEMNMKRFAPEYEKRLDLSKQKTLLYKFPLQYMSPFNGWVKENKLSEMQWWHDYNQLKHDRLENISNSTLNNAFLILSALHQVISQLPVFFHALLRREMISYGTSPVESLGEKETNSAILIETVMFATPYGRSFPQNIDDIHWRWYGESKRLMRFIGTE